MKNYAIICEYNPFHFGHQYQISKIKEQGGTVTAVMSGDFCQRGEVALADKYDRAKMALASGADLVLELPFPYSAAGAEKFAFGGVSIISRLGFADAISFGSECGDAELIKLTAENVLTDEFLNALSENLKSEREKPYGMVYFETYNSLFGEGVFSGSNNILGVAYASQIIKNQIPLEITTVKRAGEDYNGGGVGYPSATSIREALSEKGMDAIVDMLPEHCFSILKEVQSRGELCSAEKLFPVYAAFLRTHKTEDFAGLAENDASLASRLIKAGANSTNLRELYTAACTKKYSPSHVRRALLFAYFGVTEEMLSQPPAYTVVLAANDTGRSLLAQAKHNSDIPIITKPANYDKCGEKVAEAFEFSQRASAVRALAQEKPGSVADLMRKGPFVDK